MRYAEPNPNLRRIAVWLEDATTGEGFTGAIPAAGELLVNQDGGGWVDGDGSWVEVGDGLYYYFATKLEATSYSFTMIRVAVADARIFVFSVDIGERVNASEPLAAARRFPVYLVDADGDPVTGATPTGAERQLSKNGLTFVDTTADLVETGLGAYYFEATISELDREGFAVLKVDVDPALPYVYRWDVLPAAAAVATTIDSPYSFGDAAYVDLLEDALDRYPEQFRSDD